MTKKTILALAFAIALVSCKENTNKETNNNVQTETPSGSGDDLKMLRASVGYHSATNNDATANKVRGFLENYLKRDLSTYAKKADISFSFYEIDLNDDKQNEVLVYPNDTKGMFCGTGGCTFYLLNSDMSLNTNFIGVSDPIYVSDVKTNGWRNLVLENSIDDKGNPISFINLTYNPKTKHYLNPSAVKPDSIAPSTTSLKMWDIASNFAKPYQLDANQKNETANFYDAEQINKLNQMITAKGMKSEDDFLKAFRPNEVSKEGKYTYHVDKKDYNRWIHTYIVTEEGLLDDAIFGRKTGITIYQDDDKNFKVLAVSESLKCNDGRGHTDWSAEPCK